MLLFFIPLYKSNACANLSDEMRQLLLLQGHNIPTQDNSNSKVYQR